MNPFATNKSNYVNTLTLAVEEEIHQEINQIKLQRLKQQKFVCDLSLGDPNIPLWKPLREALIAGAALTPKYPSIRGTRTLEEAHLSYLSRRCQIKPDDHLMVLPTRGSKEAIFHIALSIIGRAGGRHKVLYPIPGYPIYRTSILFARGTPIPVTLSSENDFLLKPWDLPKATSRDCAAIWINYPHNPTGTCAPKEYLGELIDWCHSTNTILLSDDCYLDVYPSEPQPIPSTNPPITPLSLSTDRVISFMTLSKRSGFTGLRAGFMAGDQNLLAHHIYARSHFGLANPEIIQNAAALAWNNDSHVDERRAIFTNRMNIVRNTLKQLGFRINSPKGTFYFWVKVPSQYQNNDIKFCCDLAKKGVITLPSSHFSEGNIKGYFRISPTAQIHQYQKAIAMIEEMIDSQKKSN